MYGIADLKYISFLQVFSSTLDVLAEYPPFGRVSASASDGCAWCFRLWVVSDKLVSAWAL